jgi:hypothetical protein
MAIVGVAQHHRNGWHHVDRQDQQQSVPPEMARIKEAYGQPERGHKRNAEVFETIPEQDLLRGIGVQLHGIAKNIETYRQAQKTGDLRIRRAVQHADDGSPVNDGEDHHEKIDAYNMINDHVHSLIRASTRAAPA